MQTPESSSVLRRNPAVSGQRPNEDGHLVLYNSDTGQEKIINRTGIAIWRALDGVLTLEDLAERIASEFEADVPCNALEKDVQEFAEMLLAEKLALVERNKTSAADAPDEYCLTNDAPRHLDLCLTGKCNLSCRYCFYSNEMVGRNDLPAEEWLLFFGELKSLGVRTLTLSGGEVFVRRDFWELVDAIIEARMRFSILTNGTLVDETILEEFAARNRRRRLSSIQVSIDGSCAEVHDKSRGKGCFDRAIRAMRLLKEERYPLTSRVTVNRHNVDDLANVAKLLLEDIGLGSISTNSAMPMGAGCSNQADIALLPRQQLQAMRTLQELAKKYDRRITAGAGPLVKIESYRDMERARLFGRKATGWKMGCLSACGGAFLKLSVNHDGVITPCNMLPCSELGRINRDSISTIWRSHPTQQALRDRMTLSTSEASGCGDCEWAPHCNGSCPGLANELTGSFNSGNPHDCYRNFLKPISPDEPVTRIVFSDVIDTTSQKTLLVTTTYSFMPAIRLSRDGRLSFPQQFRFPGVAPQAMMCLAVGEREKRKRMRLFSPAECLMYAERCDCQIEYVHVRHIVSHVVDQHVERPLIPNRRACEDHEQISCFQRPINHKRNEGEGKKHDNAAHDLGNDVQRHAEIEIIKEYQWIVQGKLPYRLPGKQRLYPLAEVRIEIARVNAAYKHMAKGVDATAGIFGRIFPDKPDPCLSKQRIRLMSAGVFGGAIMSLYGLVHYRVCVGMGDSPLVVRSIPKTDEQNMSAVGRSQARLPRHGSRVQHPRNQHYVDESEPEKNPPRTAEREPGIGQDYDGEADWHQVVVGSKIQHQAEQNAGKGGPPDPPERRESVDKKSDRKKKKGHGDGIGRNR